MDVEPDSVPIFVRAMHAAIGALVGAALAALIDAGGPVNWLHMALGGLIGAVLDFGVTTWLPSWIGNHRWFS